MIRTHSQSQLEVKNCFDGLLEVDDPETMHIVIVEIVVESAQKVISNLLECRPKKWVLNATLTLVVNRGNAKKRYHQKKKAAAKEKWKNLAKQVQESCLEDGQRFIERQIAELKQTVRQGLSRWTWKIMNDISRKFTKCPASKVNE